MFTFKENDFVEFNFGDISGTGFIRGVASIAQPVIGATYIIEVSTMEFELEYSCIAIFEKFIRLVNR